MKYLATSVIGLSKNAGKTSLLNLLIEKYQQQKKIIGLASIGVDGEEKDVWSGKEKIPIYVPEKTIIVTTSDALNTGSASLKILDKFAESSSLGTIYLAEVIEPGTVKLLGTPTINNILDAFKLFHLYGANQFLVDGAYDRFSNADPALTDQTYIVVGASLHSDYNYFWQKVEEKLSKFFYQRVMDNQLLTKAENHHDGQTVLIMKDNKWQKFPISSLYYNTDILQGNIQSMILAGVLTDSLLEKMLRQNKAWIIILKNGLKSFASPKLLKLWEANGGALLVTDPVKVKGIAINPSAPDGYSFNSSDMKERLQIMLKRLNQPHIPVFDIWRDDIEL